MTSKGRRVLYQETAAAIREQIVSGKLAAGERVGASLASMAAEHHVGIATMRAALTVLSDEGLVETIPGVGTLVLAPPAPRPATMADAQSAIVEQSVADHEVDIMELYTRLGWVRPSEQRDGNSGKARHEQAG